MISLQTKSQGWPTSITRIETDRVEIAGIPIAKLVGRRTLPEVTHLLIQKTLPLPEPCRELKAVLFQGAALPLPSVKPLPGESVAKTLARCLLGDEGIMKNRAERPDAECAKTAFCLGRVLRAMAFVLGKGQTWEDPDPEEPFSHLLYRVVAGQRRVREEHARMLEAITVACSDHGVTPPSTQACVLAASARASYEVAVAHGVSCISDVHGGACGRASEFFVRLREQTKKALDPSDVLRTLIEEALSRGERIPGLGHRVHTADPRCDALLHAAEEIGVAADCVRASKAVPGVFSGLRGVSLPTNVDGVIGAIVADMGFRPIVATLTFILGRVAGLSAHYFEEVGSFPPMRWINFQEAVYRAHPTRPKTPE